MRKKLNLILVLFLALILSITTSCKTKKYELKYETNGGNVISSVTVKEGTEVNLETPTKENSNFKGWYISSDLKGDSVTSVKVNSNMTVYAAWADLVKISFDLDGGNLGQTEVYGEVGQSVLELVKDLKPTKSGLVFGAWFIGETEITSSTKLTSKGLTLKAKYQVKYETIIYKQNLNKDGYEEVKEEKYGYVGKTITLNENIEGFTEVAKSDTLYEITLDADSSKNVLKLYFDRNEYTITLRSNYPNADLKENTKVINILYGEEKELPSVDFSCEGYYLLGFSTTVDGKMEYDAHFIDNILYNQDKVEVEMPKLSTSRNISLYAVWNKGYKDMFGGSDYLFLTGDKETIYLNRGGVYFVGEYFESDNGFIFYNDFENIEGIIFENETFAYYNDKRDEYSATLYEVGTGLNDDEKILFDAYNGITYSKVVEGKTDLSKGTYIIDENNYYIASFTEGTLAGTTLKLVIGTVTLNGAKTDAYQVCNEAHASLGQLVRFAVKDGQITYYTTAYQIILSGFGTLVMHNGNNQATTYYYVFDEEKNLITLTNSQGSSAGVIKLLEFNGTNGYMVYTESLDHEFKMGDDTLVLDGVVNAKYTSNGKEVTGYYTTKSSAFGGQIVTFVADNNTYTFLTSTTTETVTKDNGKGENVEEKETYYNFEVKQNGYAEYYYKDKDGTYYAPLVVVNDSKDNYTKVYGYTKSKTFKLILEGTFVLDDITKLYTFETVNVYEEEVLTSPINLQEVKKFICSLDTTTTSYAINYWYSSTIGDVTTNYEEQYTSLSASTTEKLTLISGIAIFAKDGYVITGTYASKYGLTTITSSSGYVYLELDTENKTFVTLEYAPYNAYIADEKTNVSQKLYLSFNGKGQADYCYYETEIVDEKETEVLKKITGTVTKLDEVTKQGYQVYEFKSDEKTFKYLVVTSSSTTYILPAYGTYQGNYTSSDGILYLDGYSYYASFTDKDAVEYVGMYTASDNVVTISTTSGTLYFDLKENKSFSVRGKDYGTYILMDNQGAPGLYLEFNGYGVLTVYKMNYNEETKEYDKQVICDNGSYSNIDGLYSLLYIDSLDNNKEVTLNGYLSTYTYNSNTYKTFAIDHKEVVQTFVNTKDWSILKLDSIGNATLIDNKGNVEKGTFMLITDSLLYYVKSDSSDANIYKYNLNKGTITPSEFTARGYYTADLKSLLFSKYGFAIFNNETRYYYTMNGNDVIIYHQDAQSEQANKYGFVEENFGEFANVKQYGGETYYANDGYAITFARLDATKSKYPVLVDSKEERYATLEDLTFTPSGGAEFSVTGTVKIDGNNQTCYVTRKLVDDQYVMYITVGYYEFTITANFTGKDDQGVSNSTYEVTNLRYVRSFYPYNYLNNYYMIYSFYGATYAYSYQNDLGMVYMYKIYDEDGKVIDDYMKVDFYEGQTNVYDLDGTYLGVEHGTYTYENNIYTIEVTGTDGYTYEIHLYFQNHKAFSMYGYRLYALTRKEVVKDGDYELTIERLIATDTSYAPGTIYSVSLSYKGEEISDTQVFTYDDKLQYVTREINDETKLITKTTYYILELVSKDVQVVGEEEKEVVSPYESLKVTKVEASTYYSSNEEEYVDIVNGKVTLIKIGSNLYIPTSSEYNNETNTYTINLSSGKKYTVNITNNIMTYAEVLEEVNE